jgi:hypothetical protein
MPDFGGSRIAARISMPEYGHRFFGDSYSFEARRETRLLTLRASYTEDPEVETRRVGIDFDPDDFPLPPSPDFAFLSSSPYVRKDASVTAIVEGTRTEIRLDVYDHKREYIQNVLPDEETTGVLLSVARDMGATCMARSRDVTRTSCADRRPSRHPDRCRSTL